MTRSTRWVFGAALVTIVPLVGTIVTARRAGADSRLPTELAFSNSAGELATLTTSGAFDAPNPFFADLGSNGRACVTCHQPAQAWSITPAEVTERFERTSGLDPIFRVNDGSNCDGADTSTLERRREAFSALMTRGVIRTALSVPANAEFEVASVEDPYGCGAAHTSVSMYRRPLPTTNLPFVSAVMWDGRASAPGHAIKDDLLAQAADATRTHAAGLAPSPAQLRQIVEFELGLATAQVRDQAAGSLRAAGARGGPATIARERFCIGINDPLGMRPAMPGACLAASSGLDPVVFRLFNAWKAGSLEQQSIARGEEIFNTRQFVIDTVPGLNAHSSDPVAGPLRGGTCTVCHDTPNAGNHSVPMALNIGIAAASRRAPDQPLYTLRNTMTGQVVRTTDPGRAMVTGKWKDIGKFKGPVLRALAARPPYFHDGSAATLAEVIAFYDARFRIQLSDREKADLLAFLRAL